MSGERSLLCSTISYRSGFIEVAPNIHPGCVNIEAWDVLGIPNAPKPSIDEFWNLRGRDELEVQSTVELELTAEEAREFAQWLLNAADAAESHESDSARER